MKLNDKLIEELYAGNLVPSNSLTHKTDKYISASKQDECLYKQFVKTLNENQAKQLEELLEARATETDEMVLGSFKDGSKLGMRLTVEGLSSNFIDEE